MDRRQIKLQAKKIMLAPRRPSLFIITLIFLLIGILLEQINWTLSDVGRFLAGLVGNVEMVEQWAEAFETAILHGVFTPPADLPVFTVTIMGTLFLVVTLVFRWMIDLGYIYYIKGTVQGETLGFRSLFEGFNYFIRGIFIRLIQTIIVGLGFFFFVVPGIVAMCAFSQVNLLLLDHPKQNIFWYFSESQRLMQGRKMEYFQLVFSFFGWFVLRGIPLITLVVALWLEPYLNTSKVFFYQKITGQSSMPEAEWKRPGMF